MSTPVSQRDESSHAFRFGSFVLDLDRECLCRDGHELRLRPKSLAVLAYLVRHGGRLVTKEELLDAIWGHRYITEGSLTQCLVDIRRAIGDQGHEMVRTVPRRGFIFEPEVTAESSVSEKIPARPPVHRRVRATVVAITMVLLVFGIVWGARYVAHGMLPSGEGASSASANSIAVLPFADMSKSGDNEYFVDGLTEEVLDALTQIPGLKVTARSSSFAFKGRSADIPTVANKLHVAYVLEGSVRKSGDMVRITVQLVDSRTDSHVWSRTFDRELGNVFSVQSEIANLVAQSLQISRSGKTALSLSKAPDPEANEHYMRGNYFWQRRAEGDRALAEREFRKAVELDPGFGRAWVALAGAYFGRNQLAQTPESDWLPHYKDMLERALAADPDLAEAHARLVFYYSAVGDRKSAWMHLAKAQALQPDSVLVLGISAGWALYRGLYGEAIALQRRAEEVDPLAAVVHTNLASYLLAAGRFREAESELRQGLELSPNFEKTVQQVRGSADELALIRILRHRYAEALTLLDEQPESAARDENLALADWGLGRKAEFEKAVARLSQEEGWHREFRMAELCAFRGETDQAFKHLQAVNARFAPETADSVAADYIIDLRISPLFIPLRKDPRWQQLWSKWKDWM